MFVVLISSMKQQCGAATSEIVLNVSFCPHILHEISAALLHTELCECVYCPCIWCDPFADDPGEESIKLTILSLLLITISLVTNTYLNNSHWYP